MLAQVDTLGISLGIELQMLKPAAVKKLKASDSLQLKRRAQKLLPKGHDHGGAIAVEEKN